MIKTFLFLLCFDIRPRRQKVLSEVERTGKLYFLLLN